MAATIRSFDRLVLCLACVLFITQQSSAKTHDVGGALGWTDFDTAISAAPNYDIWTSEHTINVGDVLVFSFPAGYQNVYLMPSEEAHESCDFSEATELDAGNAGTYAWRATKEGTYYFSCNKVVEGLGTHCEAGQKLVITVTAGSLGSSTYTSLPAEIKPVSYLEQRFSRYMMESLAAAPALAPVSPPAPVPVGAPVPVPSPTTAPAPSSLSLPLASPPAPPSAPVTAPASAPGKSAGVKVSTQAFAGVLTAMLALVALWL